MTAACLAARTPAQCTPPTLRGDLAVWFFILAELLAFGVFFLAYTFYMFYLSLTGFHFLHVVLGMAVLGILWQQTRAGAYGAHETHDLASGAAYWHMVDLVRLILFPLVYVMR